MNTHAMSLTKYLVGLAVALLAMVALVTPAAAESQYYYQTQPVQWQYQQPVYYQYQVSGQQSAVLAAQLRALIAQLDILQKRYAALYGHSYGSGHTTYYNSNRDYDLEVDTLYARDVDDDEATLYGEVDLDNAPYVDVWFEYGEDSDLDEESDEERVDDDGRFSIEVDDLDEDERYYFRAVAEAPNGDRAYGQIKSFDADDYGGHDDDDERPDAETIGADDITDYSAEMEGRIDMNDFDNGDVFFVWGEDEDLVEAVEDEDSYNDIDQKGDDLRKYRAYDNLDGERTIWLEVFSLDDNTDYYFRICVEYEDEDGDDALECGDVEHFETDN